MVALYAKLLVVVGIAAPVTTSLNRRVPVALDQVTGDIVGPYMHPPHFSPRLAMFLHISSYIAY